ncbi:MAG: hypothetical protein LBT76_00370 [Tannerella sp.]|jgi:hypothetical protein|nr:hypothetical protein [Tannerella sp.]
MTCVELYRLMEQPELLSEKTVSELRQLMEDFPYFPVTRMLYLKNLAKTEDLRLKTDLKKMAIHVPDRQKLFLLLEGDRYKPAAQEPEPETKTEDSRFELVEKFLLESGLAVNPSSASSPVYAPSSASDYTYWLLSEHSQTDNEGVALHRQDLIDSFLESEGMRIGRRLVAAPSSESGKPANEPNLTASEETESISASTPYFTETLAHIYIKQKRYRKALEIIKSLSLKYPEKNIYFADQIRFLEKLIIYTKS